MSYDQAKAEAFNRARAQGLNQRDALAAAGITSNERFSYALDPRGKIGPREQIVANLGQTQGSVTQPTGSVDSQGRPVEVLTGRAAAQARAEEAAFQQTGAVPLTPYAQTATPAPGTITRREYTETSTTAISGGGSTTIVANPGKATPASQALDAQAQQTQQEIEALQLANSGFGPGPQLSEAQQEANDARILALQQQYNTQRDAAESAKIPSPPSISTVPNTTTTINTVAYERSIEVTPPVSIGVGTTPTLQPSGSNNASTAAEYQAAADEITEILLVQRQERAPIEAQQELLQNRAELLFQRQQQALNTLRAAEADPTNTAFLEQSRLAYNKATGEVNTVNTAIQQNQSVLAQSRQASSELQDQRTNLEVKAEFADRSFPTLNSLTPPATTVPDQLATYVPPPDSPVRPEVSPSSLTTAEFNAIYASTNTQEISDSPSAATNRTTKAEYQAAADEVFEIQVAARANSAQLANQVVQNQEAYSSAENRATQLRREYRAAEEAGASGTELASLAADYEAQLETANQLGQQLNQSEAALVANQQYRQDLSEQESYLFQQASQAALGPPGLNSVPSLSDDPAQIVTRSLTPVANNFDAVPVNPSGDEAIAAAEQAQADDAEAFGAGALSRFPPPLNAGGDEAIAAAEQAQADDAEAFGAGALTRFPPPLNAGGDEAIAAAEQAQADDAEAFGAESLSRFPPPLNAGGDEAIAAAEQAQADDAEAFGAGALTRFPPPFAASGDEAIAAAEQAQADDAEAFGAGALNPPPDGSFDRQEAAKLRAKQQSTLQARVNVPSAADWRVRLQLAKSADYLYRDDTPGILKPLVETDGVIFPYTPQIDSSYKANYDPYDLIHSNYRGYFYKSSSVTELTVKGTFTAQDTREAQYLLAVIHFFRSVTKMFYGKDPQRGIPPPLVYLSAYGQYQYNRHPCLVTTFSYNLPIDVDYIRADGFNNYGVNLENRRSRSSGPAPGGTLSFIKDKLRNNGLFPGGQSKTPAPPPVNQNVNNTNPVNSTYVPTKMDISITLLPVQTRSQVSKQFSLQSFANGDLLKGGFW